MTHSDLQKLVNAYSPALSLEDVFPTRFRKAAMNLLTPVIFLLFIPIAAALFGSQFNLGTEIASVLASINPLVPALSGIFLIFLSIDLIVLMSDAFAASSYFKAFDSIMEERGIAGFEPISFEASSFFYHAPDNDITAGLLKSSYGKLLLARLGISKTDLDAYMEVRKNRVPIAALNIASLDAEYGITLVDIALLIFQQDKEFSKFLFSKNVQEKDLIGAANWIVRAATLAKRRERFWSRDTLGRVPGIGKDWAFGGAYRLDKYASDLTSKNIAAADFSSNYLSDEVREVEMILTKGREANVILVGEPGGGAQTIVDRLARMIETGTILPALENKRMMMFSTDAFFATHGDKISFESELIKTLVEAVKAGNIIMVIADLPHFIESAAAIGSDAVSIIDSFLASPDFQVIALATPSAFHKAIEPNTLLMKRFEKVLVKAGSRSGTLSVLEDEVARLEARGRLFFTYEALEAIADGATRYFPEGIMPDKAVDLLSEIATSAEAGKLKIIGKNEVLDLIQRKTGIPTGDVRDAAEREKLLHLEGFLHKRVVGQEEAVKAISNAMRRARSGIENPNRPIGSFLFLGPTGVGKTETTKALAEAFFESENKILRLDMSEYVGDSAMDKLIGSFDRGRPGTLSSMLRENPYGVLLLDEFEKTTKQVMDLFLQVLDEGFFSDMSGKKVNARNLIIIATSNAGSDLIWQFMKQGGSLETHKTEIVDAIVKNGIYPPELLNRFDGIILFHPVESEDLRAIAKLQLEKLQTRLRDRGVELKINDALVNELMKYGTDPKFGARPMNRAIQDKVEEIIAEKLIKGEVRVGDTVELTESELSA